MIGEVIRIDLDVDLKMYLRMQWSEISIFFFFISIFDDRRADIFIFDFIFVARVASVW